MRISVFLASVLVLLLGVASDAAAQQPRRYVLAGAANIDILTSPEFDMRRKGIPELCRNGAHEVLMQRIGYGYDTPPYNNDAHMRMSGVPYKQNKDAKLDVFCEYYTDVSGGKMRMQGPGTGYGRVRYVRFRSATKNFEIFVMHRDPAPQMMTFWQNLMSPVNSVEPPSSQCSGATQCERGGNCSGGASLLATPVSGARISSHPGSRPPPRAGASSQHQGVDYAVSTGTPVVAAGFGQIISASCQGRPCDRPCSESSSCSGAGNFVSICHSGGTVSRYFHLSRIIKSSGQVQQNETIGLVGSTGGSTGPHLHYEVYRQASDCSAGEVARGNRQYLNPLAGLPAACTFAPLSPGQVAEQRAVEAQVDEMLAAQGEGGLANEVNPEASGACTHNGLACWRKDKGVRTAPAPDGAE